ncbi:MAG: hypothetical protein CMO81_08465 [Waddliaceae bacterium]|nr:hypothetical protein [Waddliaceae bacterium]
MMHHLKKLFLLSVLALGIHTTDIEGKDTSCGVVDFARCMQESKLGKSGEQEFETLRQQMAQSGEAKQQEMQALAKKLQDEDYMDSLSPEAEAELKQNFERLGMELQQFQQVFYQTMNQANYSWLQLVHGGVEKAAALVAESEKVDLVVNQENVFFSIPALDLTEKVIAQMNKTFAEEKAQEESEEQAAS